MKVAARENQQIIDELWDFADPAASEARLRAAAPDSPGRQRRDVLTTQIARALGLRGVFDEALAVLDEAAFERASDTGFEHLAIDALHMVAIVAPADEQLALNQQALSLASAASDPRARDWRASLLNNLGWTRFEAGELDYALTLFTEAVEERVRQGMAREIGVARWSVGRTLRALGRTQQALTAQVDLLGWMSDVGLTDSYVDDEIAECLTSLGQLDEAAAHFASTADLLEAAGPGEEADPERLARLRGLAGQSMTTPDPGTG